MAYRISYEWQKEKSLEVHRSSRKWLLPGMLLLALVITVRLLFPESTAVFRELLHPFTDEASVEAFTELVEQIAGGADMGDAVTAFCREIIANGGA